MARGVAAIVEDHSVAGYGLDQIFLRLRARASSLASGTPVVIGILTTDIDRAVLWEREAPKPRFVFDARGELTLETAHLAGPMPAPEARLLTWARLTQYWGGRLARASGVPHAECRVEEKQQLAKALLSRIAEVCSDGELRCLVVPFLRAEDLEREPGWRERLIESETSALAQVPMRSVIGEASAHLYRADRHPSRHQNVLVGEAIADWVTTTLTAPAQTP